MFVACEILLCGRGDYPIYQLRGNVLLNHAWHEGGAWLICPRHYKRFHISAVILFTMILTGFPKLWPNIWFSWSNIKILQAAGLLVPLEMANPESPCEVGLRDIYSRTFVDIWTHYSGISDANPSQCVKFKPRNHWKKIEWCIPIILSTCTCIMPQVWLQYIKRLW